MIKINNLKFSIHNAEILKNISITAEDGEIVGIIGKTGSGKSILMKILSGLLKGYDGEILLNNKDISGFSKHELQREISYFINAEPDNPEDSVYNFSLLSRVPYKSIFKPFTEYDLQVTDDYIEKFDLGWFKNYKLGQLSDCMLKKVMLAHAFIRESPLLLLDNPTGNIDISSLAVLRKCLLKYVINGDRIVLIASSDLNFILQTADRIIILDNGTVAEQGVPGIINSDLIKKYFGVEVLMSRNIYNGKPEVHLFPET